MVASLHIDEGDPFFVVVFFFSFFFPYWETERIDGKGDQANEAMKPLVSASPSRYVLRNSMQKA